MEFGSKKRKDLASFPGSYAATLPNKPNCFDQVKQSGSLSLYQMEQKFNEEQHNQELQRGRNSMGLAVPLRITMDRWCAQGIGRLPFLRSSNLMDDVITGRCDTISFNDFMNLPENDEELRSPHLVMEEVLGMYDR